MRRLEHRIRAQSRQGRGRSLGRTVEDLTPLLRGWVAYYREAEVRPPLAYLDRWLRRRLRCLLWRLWKHPVTRARRLRQLGLDGETARLSAGNGLVSPVDTHRRLQCVR